MIDGGRGPADERLTHSLRFSPLSALSRCRHAVARTHVPHPLTTYTPRGALASQTTGGVTTSQTFDAFDRLVTDGTATYAYDGLDRLAHRTVGGATTSLAYANGENDAVAVLNAAGTVTSKYGRTPGGSPLGVLEGSASALALSDVHG
jgi:hypothetical protein